MKKWQKKKAFKPIKMDGTRDVAEDLFVKGHEEGHAILLLGQSERLFNSLKERGFKIILSSL